MTRFARASIYDFSQYPTGVLNPLGPRVHAWKGGPLNEGSRYHGPVYSRPMPGFPWSENPYDGGVLENGAFGVNIGDNQMMGYGNTDEQATRGIGEYFESPPGVEAYREGVFMDRSEIQRDMLQSYKEGSLGAIDWSDPMIYAATAVALVVIGAGAGAIYAKATKKDVKTHAVAGLIAAIGVQAVSFGITKVATA